MMFACNLPKWLSIQFQICAPWCGSLNTNLQQSETLCPPLWAQNENLCLKLFLINIHRLNVTSYLSSQINIPEACLLYGEKNPYRTNNWGELFWIKMSSVFEKKNSTLSSFLGLFGYVAVFQIHRLFEQEFAPIWKGFADCWHGI